MPTRGFTLVELLVTVVVLVLLVTMALPAFSHLMRETRTHNRAQELYQAAQLARTSAITHNQRVTLGAAGQWSDGWQVFVDSNHNGQLDPGEALLARTDSNDGIRIVGNQWVTNHVSFIGTGESRYANGGPGGAFQAGRITLCTAEGEPGYELTLARSGRLRMRSISWDQCL